MWLVLALVLLVSIAMAAVVERRLCRALHKLLDRTTYRLLEKLGLDRSIGRPRCARLAAPHSKEPALSSRLAPALLAIRLLVATSAATAAEDKRPRLRDLGSPSASSIPAAQRDHRRARRARRTSNADRGRAHPHRRDGDRAARRQRLPGQDARGSRDRQRLRQAHGHDADHRARRDRNADPADEHARRRARLPKAPCAGRSRSPATNTCSPSTRSSAKPTTGASTTSARERLPINTRSKRSSRPARARSPKARSAQERARSHSA